MAVTDTQIVNKAFILLGSSTRIASLSDSTPIANQAADLWDLTVRELLSRHPWNFAVTRTEVQRDADWVSVSLRSLYRYTLPADCLRWLPPDVGEPDYFEAEEEGGKLLCDSEGPIVVRYIANVPDVSRWSPSFSDALAYRLAYELAESVSANQSLRDRMMQGHDDAIMMARRQDGLATGRNKRNSLVDRSSHLASRHRAGGGYFSDIYRFGTS